jgi:hypothetical protein
LRQYAAVKQRWIYFGVAAFANQRLTFQDGNQAQQRAFHIVVRGSGVAGRRLRKLRFKKDAAAIDGLAQAFAGGHFLRRAHAVLEQRQCRTQIRRQLAHDGPLRQCAYRGEQRRVAVLLRQALAQGLVDVTVELGAGAEYFQLGLRA